MKEKGALINWGRDNNSELLMCAFYMYSFKLQSGKNDKSKK